MRSDIVSKGIVLLHCLSFSGNDIVTCQTKMGSRDLYPVSVYLGISGGTPGELTKLLDSGLPKDTSAIIGGNVNAHSTMWGSKETNRRGKNGGGVDLQTQPLSIQQGYYTYFCDKEGIFYH